MILYLDTSALVPLLVEEPTSDACGKLWDSADSITVVRLGYVEAVEALAQAARMGRISARGVRRGQSVLDELWTAVDVVEIDHTLMLSSAELAITHGLRGFDATHCAAALAVADDELVAASGDQKLLSAWREEGLATMDVNA